MRRAAFTLIELLVVMVVILILVGILIPTISMIRRQAKDVQCMSNLQQIGIGITAFQQANNNYFPRNLSKMFAKGQSLEGEKTSILLCPHDVKKGTDQNFNRIPQMGQTPELYDSNQPDPDYVAQKLSYMFEAAEILLGPAATNPPDGKPWFDIAGEGVGEVIFDSRGKTWAAAKIAQLKHFKKSPSRTWTPCRPENFPIVRCFWHASWEVGDLSTKKKVMNLTWAMSTKWTVPKWEDEINL